MTKHAGRAPIGPRTGQIRANGMDHHFIEAGEGPLVLALHGFPDLPQTFEHQMACLAAAGYRVVAPYLRGYLPGLPPGARLGAPALAQDAVALCEALDPGPAVILGHDWGAHAGYGAAILAPRKIAALVALSVPPGLGRFILSDPLQQRRSWYMFFFQLPTAEKAVALNDLAFVERLWKDWSPGWEYPQASMAELKAALSQAGVLPAVLGHYRQTLNPGPMDAEELALRKRLAGPVPVPTLYLHGADDGCVGTGCTEGMEAAFSSRFGKKILPGGGHFIHREQPGRVNDCIIEFLGSL